METSTVQRGEAARSFVEALLDKLTSHTTIAKFLVVGAMGYLVYQTTLFLVYDVGVLSFLPDKGVSGNIILFNHGNQAPPHLGKPSTNQPSTTGRVSQPVLV